MSLSSYQPLPYRIWIVQYSYMSKGDHKRYNRVSYASTEEDALVDTYENVLVSWLPSFKAEVIGYRQY